jgi:hypothetical protein
MTKDGATNGDLFKNKCRSITQWDQQRQLHASLLGTMLPLIAATTSLSGNVVKDTANVVTPNCGTRQAFPENGNAVFPVFAKESIGSTLASQNVRWKQGRGQATIVLPNREDAEGTRPDTIIDESRVFRVSVAEQTVEQVGTVLNVFRVLDFRKLEEDLANGTPDLTDRDHTRNEDCKSNLHGGCETTSFCIIERMLAYHLTRLLVSLEWRAQIRMEELGGDLRNQVRLGAAIVQKDKKVKVRRRRRTVDVDLPKCPNEVIQAKTSRQPGSNSDGKHLRLHEQAITAKNGHKRKDASARLFALKWVIILIARVVVAVLLLNGKRSMLHALSKAVDDKFVATPDLLHEHAGLELIHSDATLVVLVGKHVHALQKKHKGGGVQA